MVELITDRTQYHVTLLDRLRRKPWNSMTASEQAAWTNGEAALGAYNYTDFNRVESAVAELAEQLGLTLTTKTNWTLWDIPVQADMERYLGNVVAIRDTCPGNVTFPELPASMSYLTFDGANSIEKVLMMVYEELNGGSGGEDPEYRYLWIQKVEGTTVYVSTYVADDEYADVSDSAEERSYNGGLWFVYRLPHDACFRFSIDGYTGVIDTTGLVYYDEYDDYGFDSDNAYVYVGSTGDPDTPVNPGDADYIRSGEIYSGEVI